METANHNYNWVAFKHVTATDVYEYAAKSSERLHVFRMALKHFLNTQGTNATIEGTLQIFDDIDDDLAEIYSNKPHKDGKCIELKPDKAPETPAGETSEA